MRCLTIHIHALNEEEYISKMVKELLPVVRRELDRFELILVNDGSTDRTGEIMDFLASEYLEVRVIHNSERLSQGGCVRKAIEAASFDYIMSLGGDNPFNAKSLVSIFKAMDVADMVIAYRTNQGESRALLRFILSRLYHFFLFMIFGLKVKDPHGVQLYPIPVLRSLDLQLIGYGYNTELLVKLQRRGISFVEVPVSLNTDNPQPSRAIRLEVLGDIIKTIRHLLKTR